MVGVGWAILGLNPFVTTFQPSFVAASFSFYIVAIILAAIGSYHCRWRGRHRFVVLGAGASLSVRTESTLASSRITLSDVPSCL